MDALKTLEAPPGNEGRERTGVKEFPLPPADIHLEKFEIPASPRARARLRAQIERELITSEQEKEVLEKDIKSDGEVPTSVKGVTEFIVGRAKAVNPIRDFNKVGAAVLYGGRSPWKDTFSQDEPPWPIITGMMACIMTAAVLGPFAHPALTIGAAAFAAAPLFLSMWGGRTIFNFCAGILTAAAAPFAYAAARIADVRRHPGYLNAKRFLRDLKHSVLKEDDQTEMRSRRISYLENEIAEHQKRLSEIEASDEKNDKARLSQQYLHRPDSE